MHSQKGPWVHMVSRGKQKRKSLVQLGDVIHIAHTRRSCDLRSILLVLVELRVNVFRDLWEWIRGVSRPEEVLGIEVISLLLWSCDRDAIQPHLEAVRNERLVGPAM